MAIASGKAYSAGAFALEIDGMSAGFLGSVEGGSAFGDVVDEPPGADGIVHKHLAGVRYDDIVVTSPLPDGNWADWLTAFLEGKAPQHDGAITFLNYNYVPIRRLEFKRAVITALTFPKLDGAGKQPGYLTVVLRPEEAVEATPTGSSKGSGVKQKTWTVSNFVVEIPGVDCSRVSSVAALTVSQAVTEDAVGAVRIPTRQTGPLRVGDLVLTVAQSHAADFAAWRDDFIIRGHNSSRDEKTATVRLMTADFKKEVFSFVLKGVGIHRLDPDKQVQGATSIARVTAAMYCERAELVLPKPPAAAPAPTPAPGAEPAPGRTSPGRSVLDVLGERRVEPLEVARRLLATSEPGPALSDSDGQRQRGVRLGAAWAQQVATLAELTELAAAARGDWSAVALPEGHSLVEALQDAEVVPTAHVGDLELARDSFVEGLLAGADDTYEAVRAHLEQPEP